MAKLKRPIGRLVGTPGCGQSLDFNVLVFSGFFTFTEKSCLPKGILMLAKAVAFDAYGTLCFIGSPTYPYRKLLKSLSISPGILRQELMTKPTSLEEFASKFDIDNPELVARIEDLIQQEVKSVKLYPEVMDTLQTLKMQEFKLAIVSNLAYPYSEPIVRYFSPIVDHLVFSFEVGATKPDPGIFQVLCEKLTSTPEQIVMIGDSILSDIQGACDFGMQAIHLERKATRTQVEKKEYCIDDISIIPDLVERII